MRRYEGGVVVGEVEQPKGTFREWLVNEIEYAKRLPHGSFYTLHAASNAGAARGRLCALTEALKAFDARNPVEEL